MRRYLLLASVLACGLGAVAQTPVLSPEWYEYRKAGQVLYHVAPLAMWASTGAVAILGMTAYFAPVTLRSRAAIYAIRAATYTAIYLAVAVWLAPFDAGLSIFTLVGIESPNVAMGGYASERWWAAHPFLTYIRFDNRWLISAVACSIAGATMWLDIRGRYAWCRDGVPRCDRCGYDLRGTPGQTCPECGWHHNVGRGEEKKL